MSPIQSAFFGGAAVLALSAGAAFAAADTAPAVRTEKRVVIVQNENGHTTTYDSAVDKGPPPMMHGAMPMGHGDGDHMMIMRRHGDPQQMAKHLRDVLQLTPQQEPALQALLGSMHPPAPPPGGERHMKVEIARGPDGKIDTAKIREQAEKWRAEAEKKHTEEASLTTPQRLDRMVQHMTERDRQREAEVQAHADAVKRFYAALTPGQQKAFDALHHGGMGHMGGMMMHGGPERRVEMMRFGQAPMPPMPPHPPMPPEPPLPPPPPGGL